MLCSRHRLALAAAVAVLVAGVLLSGAHARAEGMAAGGGERGSTAFALESSPVAAVAVVGRVRGSAEAQLLLVMRLAASLALAFVVIAAVGLGPRPRASWFLVRPDRRLTPPLGGSTGAALRAPPRRPARDV